MKAVDKHPKMRTAIRTMQIIIACLSIGLGTFLCSTIYLRFGKDPGDDMVMPWAAVGLLGVMLLIRMVLRAVTMGRALDRYKAGEEREFRRGFQNALIIQAALVEGPGFFGCVAYLLSGQWIALAVAVASLLALLVLIPTEASVNRLLEDLP